jgi:hypothetical protein
MRLFIDTKRVEAQVHSINWTSESSIIQKLERKCRRNISRIGLQHDAWKQSVLVYDDNGEVEKELIQHHRQISFKEIKIVHE